MKQIITLEKEIAFKTMIGDITSISLEPDLSFVNDSEIEGNLVISGTYKMTEASTIEEDFSYKIPVEIVLTTSLLEDKRKVDINNFTYQVVNEESLEIKVELLVEGLEKIEIEEESIEPLEDDNLEASLQEVEEDIRKDENEEEEDLNEIEVLTTEEETKEELPTLEDVSFKEELSSLETEQDEDINTMEDDTNNKVMDSIFSAFANTDETYSTYSVYILREDDNLEEVMAKYKTNRDLLLEYNDLDNLKVGAKLIIPATIDTDD